MNRLDRSLEWQIYLPCRMPRGINNALRSLKKLHLGYSGFENVLFSGGDNWTDYTDDRWALKFVKKIINLWAVS